jgi:hypothetical protein
LKIYRDLEKDGIYSLPRARGPENDDKAFEKLVRLPASTEATYGIKFE